MNPITRISPTTDEEAVRMARPGTLSDLARQIVATPVTPSHGASARTWADNRPRRLLLGVPLAAGLAVAVVIVAGGVPGARHDGTGGSAVNTTDVVKRVDRALSAADPGAFAQMTVTTSTAAVPGGTTAATTAEEWSYSDQWRSVTNSSAGHPIYDQGFSTSAGYTLVNYQRRTWAHQPGLSHPAPTLSGPRGCEQVVAFLPLLSQPRLPGVGLPAGSLPGTVARVLRTAISCGTLAVAGRQRVDGIEAIELTSHASGRISETIWVSPGTYLPVRVVVRSAPGVASLLTADITWLPPTARNLDRLTVPIPAGFRQVPLTHQAVKPGMQQIP
jgi:hypothetical protein